MWSDRLARLLLLSLAASGLAGAAGPDAAAEAQRGDALRRAIGAATCSGEYADDLLALTPEARAQDRRAEADFSYCLRSTATYECPYYGSDGGMHRRVVSVTAHGTAFAYREQAGESLLLTNEHVATWPEVTDDDHAVDDVPAGCRRTDVQLRLVRDESDDYEPEQVPVERVAGDAGLDAAVLRTAKPLHVMPWSVGHSSAIAAGNVVQVRGYPLGVLEAVNYGKVVSPYDRDVQKQWNHVDFVIDALVSRGNSGSPVFAVSCRTGRLEAVGLYHAGYRGSPALNVVIGIDQLRELMDHLRRPDSGPADDPDATPEAQALALQALQRPDFLPFFRVGDRTARVRLDGGALVYEVFSEAFPTRDTVTVMVRESPGSARLDAFALPANTGAPIWLPPSQADAETQAFATRLHGLVRHQLLATLRYREGSANERASREASEHAAALAREIDRRKGDAAELLTGLAEAASRVAARTDPARR